MNRELVIDARQPRTGLDLRELWRYRELLLVLVQRDIAVRYQQTALGVLWAVLQPLGMMAIFALIFGRLGALRPVDVPYPLFAFAGLLPWLFFAHTLQAAGSSVTGSRGLISKVYFPRLILPLSAVGAALVDFAVSCVMMLALVLYYGVTLSLALALLPLYALIAALTALGIGSLVAALTVFYRDVRHLLPFLVLSWMFLTPVIYPPSVIPEAWRWLLFLNPMAGVVHGMRAAWFGTPLDTAAVSCAALLSMLLFWGGVRYFRAVERRFVDEL